MGRTRLGDVIRQIDFSKEKGNPEPVTARVERVEYETREDKTFDELKDGFKAFEEKVCIPEFLGFDTMGYWVADGTLCVITRMMREFLEKHEEKTKSASEIYLHTLMSMIKAGPTSGHLQIMEQLLGISELEEYVQGLKKKDILPILSTLKVEIKHTPSKACDDKLYGQWLSGMLGILYWFSEEQRTLVQSEYLDVWLHFQKQMPTLRKDLASAVNEMVRDMVVNFEDDNPYVGIKEASLFRTHLDAMRDLACTEGYVKDKPLDKTVERTLTTIVDALIKDKKIFKDVFDHMMVTAVEIIKSPVARKQGKTVFDVFQYLFSEMKDQVTLSPAIVSSCVKLVLGVVEYGGKCRFIEKTAEKAMEDVICNAEKM